MLSENGREILEQKCALYNQRKKATNSLITTLSSVTTALNKANNSLKHCTPQHGIVSPETLANTQNAFATLRLKDDVIDPLLNERK